MSELVCAWASKKNCVGDVKMVEDEDSNWLVGRHYSVLCCKHHATLMRNGNYTGVSNREKRERRARQKHIEKANKRKRLGSLTDKK